MLEAGSTIWPTTDKKIRLQAATKHKYFQARCRISVTINLPAFSLFLWGHKLHNNFHLRKNVSVHMSFSVELSVSDQFST
jgi:hypothetical protein